MLVFPTTDCVPGLVRCLVAACALAGWSLTQHVQGTVSGVGVGRSREASVNEKQPQESSVPRKKDI